MPSEVFGLTVKKPLFSDKLRKARYNAEWTGKAPADPHKVCNVGSNPTSASPSLRGLIYILTYKP